MAVALVAILNPSWQSGLPLTAMVYSGAALAGSVAMTESPAASARYVASFTPPAGSAAYQWSAIDSNGNAVWADSFITNSSGGESEPQPDPTAIPSPGQGGRWYVSALPSSRPVTAAALAAHLRIDAEDDDDTLSLFIDAATEYAEASLSAALVPRTIVERFEDGATLDLSRGPLITVQAITDRNSSAVSGFSVRQIGYTSRIVLTSGAIFPITVTYRAGYALPNGTPAVPADIKVAILQHAATLYSNRESVTDKATTPVPHSLDAFYANKRRSPGVY